MIKDDNEDDAEAEEQEEWREEKENTKTIDLHKEGKGTSWWEGREGSKEQEEQQIEKGRKDKIMKQLIFCKA